MKQPPRDLNWRGITVRGRELRQVGEFSEVK